MKKETKELTAFMKMGIGKSRLIKGNPFINFLKKVFGFGTPVYDIKILKESELKLKGLPIPRGWYELSERLKNE